MSDWRRDGLLMITSYLAFIAILSLLTVVWWTQPFDAHAARSTLEAGSESEPQSSIGSLASYEAIAGRPLFMPTRRPTPEEADIAPVARIEPAAPARNYVLKGTILLEDDSLALLMDKRSAELVSVREGISLDGWSVGEIGVSWVKFSQNGRSATLRLPVE